MKCISESEDVFNVTKIDIAKEARELLRTPSHHIMREWIRPYMKEASLAVELDSRRRGRNDSDSESTETTAEAPTEVVASVAPVALASILEPYAINHLIYFIDLSPGS